jgi:hypothetical protein
MHHDAQRATISIGVCRMCVRDLRYRQQGQQRQANRYHHKGTRSLGAVVTMVSITSLESAKQNQSTLLKDTQNWMLWRNEGHHVGGLFPFFSGQHTQG